jgi:hypothetical protein
MKFFSDQNGVPMIPAFPHLAADRFMRVTDWELLPEARITDCLVSADTLYDELCGIFPAMPARYFENLVRCCAFAAAGLDTGTRIQVQTEQNRLAISFPETGKFMTLSEKPLQEA